jgi:virginiamycin B lyase
MPIRLRLGAFALSGCLLAPSLAGAQAMPFNQIMTALNGVHQFSEVALSPDGRFFAFVESVGDRTATRVATTALPGLSSGISCLPRRTCDTSDKITPTGTITEFAIPTALSGPVLIAAGPSNTIWFTEGSSNKIGVLYL